MRVRVCVFVYACAAMWCRVGRFDDRLPSRPLVNTPAHHGCDEKGEERGTFGAFELNGTVVEVLDEQFLGNYADFDALEQAWLLRRRF